MTLIQPSRRLFVAGLASLIAAPAIVRAASLMPVRSLKTELLVESFRFTEGTVFLHLGDGEYRKIGTMTDIKMENLAWTLLRG